MSLLKEFEKDWCKFFFVCLVGFPSDCSFLSPIDNVIDVLLVDSSPLRIWKLEGHIGALDQCPILEETDLEMWSGSLWRPRSKGFWVPGLSPVPNPLSTNYFDVSLPHGTVLHMSDPFLRRSQALQKGQHSCSWGPSKCGQRHSQFSCSVMSESLRPHGLQHSRLPCSSPTPRAYSNSGPVHQWCHPTVPSSVVLFSYHLQSFPATGSFPMRQFFASGGQSIGVSATSSVLPTNIQNWFSLGWTDWISLLSKGLSRVFSNITVQNHQFFCAQLSL